VLRVGGAVRRLFLLSQFMVSPTPVLFVRDLAGACIESLYLETEERRRRMDAVSMLGLDSKRKGRDEPDDRKVKGGGCD